MGLTSCVVRISLLFDKDEGSSIHNGFWFFPQGQNTDIGLG